MRRRFNDAVADPTTTICTITSPARLVHRRSGPVCEALRAERSVGVTLFIPKRRSALEVTALETQLLSKTAILVFEFGSRLLQFAQFVQHVLHLLFRVTVFERLPKFVKFLGYFGGGLRNIPS